MGHNYLGDVLHLQRCRVPRVDVAGRPAVVVHAIALISSLIVQRVHRLPTPDSSSTRDRVLHLSEDTVPHGLEFLEEDPVVHKASERRIIPQKFSENCSQNTISEISF